MIDETETRTVTPDRFVAGGEAMARDDEGRVVFVRGAIPGERSTVVLTERKKDWVRGYAGEIHQPSADRVEVPCEHRRDGCGGCDWQHLAVSAQLPAKAEIVRDALRRTAKLPDSVVTIGRAVPAVGYRTTIRVVGDAHRRASFRMERSHDTVSADGCLVAHPALAAALPALRIPPDMEVTLRVSVATGEMTALWDFEAGEVTGLPNAAKTGGRAKIYEEVAGHRFRVSASSFFQSGPAAAELLVEAVRRAAPELKTANTVLDAYAGVGLFALAATSPTAKLLCVESSRSSVEDCKANLDGRDGRVEMKEVGTWTPKTTDTINVVIADPASTGLGKPGVNAIVLADAPMIVLVSCDPVALARDAALLAIKGYRHEHTEVLDIFPHTHHVEAVTRFIRT